MPIIRSAIKKMRQDSKRTEKNDRIKREIKKTVNSFKKNPAVKSFALVDKTLSMAVKKNIIHKNKASRLKSRLSRLLGKNKGTPVAAKSKVTKSGQTAQKTSPKKRSAK